MRWYIMKWHFRDFGYYVFCFGFFVRLNKKCFHVSLQMLGFSISLMFGNRTSLLILTDLKQSCFFLIFFLTFILWHFF